VKVKWDMRGTTTIHHQPTGYTISVGMLSNEVTAVLRPPTEGIHKPPPSLARSDVDHQYILGGYKISGSLGKGYWENRAFAHGFLG